MAKWTTAASVERSPLHPATWVPRWFGGITDDYDFYLNAGPLRVVKVYVESELTQALDADVKTRWRKDDPDAWVFEYEEEE